MHVTFVSPSLAIYSLSGFATVTEVRPAIGTGRAGKDTGYDIIVFIDYIRHLVRF